MLLHPLPLTYYHHHHQVMAYIASQVGPSCLTQADSEGAAPIHWLCTLGGSMRHAATSAMAMPHERNRSWAHGAPVVRANISAPASASSSSSAAAAGAASAKDYSHHEDGKEGEKAKELGVDLRGCSVAVVGKVHTDPFFPPIDFLSNLPTTKFIRQIFGKGCISAFNDLAASSFVFCSVPSSNACTCTWMRMHATTLVISFTLRFISFFLLLTRYLSLTKLTNQNENRWRPSLGC